MYKSLRTVFYLCWEAEARAPAMSLWSFKVPTLWHWQNFADLSILPFCLKIETLHWRNFVDQSILPFCLKILLGLHFCVTEGRGEVRGHFLFWRIPLVIMSELKILCIVLLDLDYNCTSWRWHWHYAFVKETLRKQSLNHVSCQCQFVSCCLLIECS